MSRPESRQPTNSSHEPAPRRGGRARRGRTPRGQAAAAPSAGQAAADAQQAAGPNRGPAERPFGWSFRDFLVPYILLALSIQRAHGYFIEQYLNGLGLANVELSTIYRTLRQLEKDGLVCSSWEPGPDGPARRVYSLTDSGRGWLDLGAAWLEGYRTLIDQFFGSYTRPTRGPAGEK